ncbi:MAG TPA: NAD(P)/FAD-dependent oxidoreductase [candidate division Zixibacteria bacterium]|nr:NAD(P)/FAD-dependent oxidoreductase [candidate division Zixibacteria bacterium]MDD4918545.1 NAD(P)/FAD-dependent oxidoreductase [candidate division Zixibacteria bacterium]MDM7971938.1 NAD(P)/FAD-dependent oxidoreductase [candidate division Zixibacteria bacterium]HOD65605.1 NAD(P)/FAD-dependent oxidoreductase [candidate division Zixibacteria bacterium]HPM37112.1 NAD(P)/FAD-dependent oxidoreductase [candidate division Zixibacteria bacterium]
MSEHEARHDSRDIYDVSFIGAGPVAMYGMYYAGLRMMRAKAIDMLEEVGGGLMALYPEKYIYDVAGFPKVLAKDLVRQFEAQAAQYPTNTFCLGEKVTEVTREGDGVFRLTTDRQAHYTRTVVVCAGLGAYIPKRMDVPNVEKLEGRGVYYFCRRLRDFADKDVLIVGGGDAAFDYSMMLGPVARSVTHIHRNSFFSAHEDSVRKVKNSRVRLLYPFWELKELRGEDWVEGATIVQTRTGHEERLAVDAVVLNIGFLTNLGPIEGWGLELDKNAIRVDTRMRTNVEGIYAAGDIVTYEGKLKLISTGCGEVAIAVNNAKAYLDPRAKVSPGHSTEKHEVVMRKLQQRQQQSRGEEDRE